VAVSSWDKTVRIYDALTPLTSKAIHTETGPVLDVAFMRDSTQFICGGANKRVSIWQVGGRQPDALGKHDDAVRCIEWHQSSNQIFSGSWDKSVKAWDPRNKGHTAHVGLGGKVFSMSCSNDRLVVGLSTKQVAIYDVRVLAQPMQVRDPPLKYQLRTLRCMPNGEGFACGSVEGRVAWEYFEPQPGKAKYAFKCHRKQVEGSEHVYPVNALAFHPEHGTFASGGGDGVVSVWDGVARKRLWRLPEFETSVSSLSFSADGSRLAIAVSYTYENGPMKTTPPNKLFIRNVPDADVRPKAKA
jgi:cell cycle arrest protein BUB3